MSNKSDAEILKDRAKVLAMAPNSQNFSDIHKLLVFKLGEQEYAIDDGYIERVIANKKVITIPLISKPFVGIIYSQGEVVPVIDAFQVILNKEFNGSWGGYDLILLRFESLSLALKVTEVHSQVEKNSNELNEFTIIDPDMFLKYLD